MNALSWIRFALAFLLASFSFATVFVSAHSAPADVLQSEQALLQAVREGNQAAMEQHLDPELLWINAQGARLLRPQVVAKLHPISNLDVEPQARVYGTAAVVRANRGQMNVLRVWVLRGSQWRLILYQEVLQVEKSEPPPTDALSAPCENPCKSIPYRPETQSEQEAIASWQGVMGAMARNDAAAYTPLIADEFTATDTHRERPFTKTDRVAQIKKQQLAGTRSVPPSLVSAQMFDFGETVMMVAREQRSDARPFYNTRMWVKRDGRWQMLFSFNTRIE
jgi:hypothetical protein